MAGKAPRVHLQQGAEVAPAAHLVQRLGSRQVAVALRVGDDDATSRRGRFPHDPVVGSLQIEAELDQQPAAAGEPDVGPAGHASEQRRVGRPDLLPQAEGGQVGRAVEPLQQALEGGALSRQLPIDRRRAGQVREQQVGSGDQGPDPLAPQALQRDPALVRRGGAVVDGGNEMAVEVGEGQGLEHRWRIRQ